ncbi:ATP-binding protein [Streptomyces sp. NPDC001177]
MALQAPPQTGTAPSYGASSTVTDLSHGETRNPSRAAIETAACLVLSVNGSDLAEVPLIRRHVRAFLAPRCAIGITLDNALLVASELLTNAVVHALPPVILHVHCDNETDGLRIEVSDSGARHASGTSEADDEHGRGLEIVAALCVRHGAYTHTQGATYWAEVRP